MLHTQPFTSFWWGNKPNICCSCLSASECLPIRSHIYWRSVYEVQECSWLRYPGSHWTKLRNPLQYWSTQESNVERWGISETGRASEEINDRHCLTWSLECVTLHNYGTYERNIASASKLSVLQSYAHEGTDACEWVSSFLMAHQHNQAIHYSAIHVSVHWKIRDRRQIKYKHIITTKHNPEKANNAKYSTTKLAWFSHHIRHSARKRGGLILQSSRAHTAMRPQQVSSSSSPERVPWLASSSYVSLIVSSSSPQKVPCFPVSWRTRRENRGKHWWRWRLGTRCRGGRSEHRRPTCPQTSTWDHSTGTECCPTTHTSYNSLTLWRPLLPYGYSYKASCVRPG